MYGARFGKAGKSGVRIRLSRMGHRHAPNYRINVANRLAPRDGKFLERLGTYNPTPHPTLGTKHLRLNAERVKYWLAAGAEPSPAVAQLLSAFDLLPKQPIRSGAPLYEDQRRAAPEWWRGEAVGSPPGPITPEPRVRDPARELRARQHRHLLQWGRDGSQWSTVRADLPLLWYRGARTVKVMNQAKVLGIPPDEVLALACFPRPSTELGVRARENNIRNHAATKSWRKRFPAEFADSQTRMGGVDRQKKLAEQHKARLAHRAAAAEDN